MISNFSSLPINKKVTDLIHKITIFNFILMQNEVINFDAKRGDKFSGNHIWSKSTQLESIDKRSLFRTFKSIESYVSYYYNFYSFLLITLMLNFCSLVIKKKL